MDGLQYNFADKSAPTERIPVGAALAANDYSRTIIENSHKNNTMHKFHGKNLRRHRCSLPYYCYLLTTITHQRRPVFSDFRVARLCIHGLRLQQEQGLATTLAFVIMPDHVHWLVQLRQSELATVMHAMKGGVARLVNLYLGTSGRVWQAGYHITHCAGKRISGRWPGIWSPIPCVPVWFPIFVIIPIGMRYGWNKCIVS